MLTINNNAKRKLKHFDFNNMYVVADFDKTITVGNSKTSWSILSNSNLVSPKYSEERDELYNYYRPIELDENMDFEKKKELMKEWYTKHINLFVKYQITEDIINIAAKDIKTMEFREGAKDFLDYLYKNNIPLIINSAGIGNFAKVFLTNNNCYHPNIYISSNMIDFENGIATGIGSNIIHSLNKNEMSLPKDIKNKINNRKSILLLGDQKSDKLMVNISKEENVLYTGFVTKDNSFEEHIDNFDIIVDSSSNYFDLLKLLNRDNNNISEKSL